MIFKKIIFFIIKILISSLILFYVIKNLDIKKIFLSLNLISIYFFLFILIFLILSLFLMSLKWTLFLKKYKKIGLINLIKIYWASDFVNLLGLASIGGETYKTMAFKKDRKKVLFSSLLDKIYSFLWYILFAGSFFLSFFLSQNLIIIFLSGLLISFVLSTLFIFFDNSIKNFLNSIIKVPFLKLILTESKISKKDLFLHLIYSLLFILNTSLIYSFIFYTLGLPIKILEFFIFIPILMIAITLPISFQGIGVREFLFVKFAEYTSLIPEKVLLVSFVIYISALIYGVLGAIPFLLFKRRED